MGALLLCTCACIMHALFFSFHIYSFIHFLFMLIVQWIATSVCIGKCVSVALTLKWPYLSRCCYCCFLCFSLFHSLAHQKWMKHLNIFPMRFCVCVCVCNLIFIRFGIHFFSHLFVSWMSPKVFKHICVHPM